MLDKILGFLTPVIIYFFIFVLNAVMPGRWVTGYVTKEGTDEKLRYRLNGLIVLITVLICWVAICYAGWMSWDYLYQIRWYSLAGAITMGLIFSIVLVVPYPAVKKSFFADFYLGRLENPQLWGGRIDAKMWLYLVGSIML